MDIASNARSNTTHDCVCVCVIVDMGSVSLELMNAAHAGSTRAVEEVLDLMRGNIRILVRSRWVIGYEREDLLQEARLSVLHAIGIWDESRGVKPETLMNRCVLNRLTTLLQSATDWRRSTQRLAPLSLETISEELHPGIVEHWDAVTPEASEELWSHAHTPLERGVLGHWLEEMTMRESARLLGVTEKSVDNSRQRITRTVRGLVQGKRQGVWKIRQRTEPYRPSGRGLRSTPTPSTGD